MKKIVLALFCMLMTFSLLGCGSSKKEANQVAAKEATSSAKVLTVATDANFPPFEFYQEKTGLHTGFDIGLMRALAEEMGYEKVEFVNVEFKDILSGLQAKKYDAAIAAISVTPARKEIVAFTDTYLKDDYRVFMKRGAAFDGVLAGKTIAVEEGSYAEDLAKAQKPGKIIPVKNLESALLLVANDSADYVIGSAVSASFYIANVHGDKIKLADVKALESDSIAIAVAKDNTELQGKFNAALKELKRSGKFKAVYDSYFARAK